MKSTVSRIQLCKATEHSGLGVRNNGLLLELVDADLYDPAFLRNNTNFTSLEPQTLNNRVAKLPVILDASNAILAIIRNFPYLPTTTFWNSPEEVAGVGCEARPGHRTQRRLSCTLPQSHNASFRELKWSPCWSLDATVDWAWAWWNSSCRDRRHPNIWLPLAGTLSKPR